MDTDQCNADNKLDELIVRFCPHNNTVSANGEAYSLLSISSDHPLLDSLNRKQLFDFAYRLGGEVRGSQYKAIMKISM